jgi:hypothetical protein
MGILVILLGRGGVDEVAEHGTAAVWMRQPSGKMMQRKKKWAFWSFY